MYKRLTKRVLAVSVSVTVLFFLTAVAAISENPSAASPASAGQTLALSNSGRAMASVETALVGDVVDRVPGLAARAAYAKQALQDKLIEHKHYIREYGEDLSEIRNWKCKTR